MKPNEFKRIYSPKRGKFVYKHKGSGLVVDHTFKPMKSVVSSVFKKFAKPMAKKALESGVSHAGDKLGKKTAVRSGDLIMKALTNIRQGKKPKTTKTIVPKKNGSKTY